MDVHRGLRSWLTVLLVVVLVFGMIPAVQADRVSEAKEKLDALQEEKDALDADISDLQSKQAENVEHMEETVDQKNLIDQEIVLLYEQIDNIQEQILAYGTLIADKQDQLDAAQLHLEQLQEQNKTRLRAMEKNGKISYWSVLFQADSFTDLLDRMKMIREIAEADRARLEQVRQAAEAVEDAKDALEAEKDKLLDVQETLLDAEKQLEQKRREADSLLKKLIAKGEEYDLLIEDSEAKQAVLAEKLAKAEDEYDDAKYWQEQQNKPKPPVSSGAQTGNTVEGVTWIVPIVYDWFSSPFGYRIHPISGQWKMHNGVDLSAPEGREIYATRSGYISWTGYEEDGAGNYVQINHGDGYKSIYMHMTHYIVYVGQWVEAGQVIGYCGTTGGSTGPHLHFGISYNGEYVNPVGYINI